MSSEVEFLKHIYERFNARYVAGMHEDVLWANGMEGGYVQGREGSQLLGRLVAASCVLGKLVHGTRGTYGYEVVRSYRMEQW
ncbi:MAG: hypothetical protein WCE52_14245 [Candidatus Acidiferrum sp.]